MTGDSLLYVLAGAALLFGSGFALGAVMLRSVAPEPRIKPPWVKRHRVTHSPAMQCLTAMATDDIAADFLIYTTGARPPTQNAGEMS